MKETIALSRQQQETVKNNLGLASYLNNLKRGREATPHSWLYENESSQDTLSAWQSILNSVLEGLPEEQRDAISQLEESQLKKFGPQGQVPPILEALPALESTFTPSDYDDENYGSLFREGNPFDEEDAAKLAKLFLGNAKLMSLRPRSPERVVDDMRERDTLETNSGWPLFTRRNKPEVVQASIQDARTGHAYEYPAIILFRSYNGKLRPVWMYPMSMNIIEGSFTQVIQDTIRKGFANDPNSILGNYCAPWVGFEDVKVTMTTYFETRVAPRGGDATQMDAHFRMAQMRCVWNIVKWMFQRKYWDELWRCMQHVNDIEIVVGYNARLTGRHGIASGSGWTQLSETILQMWMAWRNGVNGGMGIGDDFVWFFDRETSEDLIPGADGLVSILGSYGLEANASKQSVEQDSTSFLQRLFIRGFMSRERSQVMGGIYPTIRALNSLLNPEKFHDPAKWNSDMFCLRCYMILENCVDHPAFEQFCAFVVKGQKDLIPFAHKAAAELNSVQRRAKLIPQLNPTYNQEKRDKSLSDFASIKYVASKW